MVHMVIILCMAQRTFLVYMPIYLDNHHHIYIPVQPQHEAVRNMTVDFRWAEYPDIYNWPHDYERSKLHLERTVKIAHMDLHNDCWCMHDHLGIHSLNCIRCVRIVQMDFLCNQIDNGMQFDVLNQNIQR